MTEKDKGCMNFSKNFSEGKIRNVDLQNKVYIFFVQVYNFFGIFLSHHHHHPIKSIIFPISSGGV